MNSIWNITIDNTECNEHWNDLLDRCRLTKDGKCRHDTCPKKLLT